MGTVSELTNHGINLNLINFDRLPDKFNVRIKNSNGLLGEIEITKDGLEGFIYGLYLNHDPTLSVSIRYSQFMSDYQYEKLLAEKHM